jgi:hypothetical protein
MNILICDNNIKMEYIYAPLYKYLALILLYFMFIRHYKCIDQDSYLLLCFIFVIITIMMDYYLIDNHPGLFTVKQVETFDDCDDDDDDDNYIMEDTRDKPQENKNIESFDDADDESIV